MKFNIDKKFIDYVAYILIAISTIFIIAFLMHNKIITNFFNDAENKSFDWN